MRNVYTPTPKVRGGTIGCLVVENEPNVKLPVIQK